MKPLIDPLEELHDYLMQHESRIEHKVRNVGLAFAIMCFYIFTVSIFLSIAYKGGFQILTPPSFSWIFLFTVVVAPLWEEYVFRVLPVALARKWGTKDLLIPFMIFSSIIFGIGHGGAVNLFIQGVMGFLMACVYVKNGFCYWSAVALHAAWNLMALVGFRGLAD